MSYPMTPPLGYNILRYDIVGGFAPPALKIDGVFSPNQNHKSKMEAVEVQTPALPAQNEAVEVKSDPPSAYECVVCYGDGKATGKLTLGCGHDVCLACFVKLQTTTGYYGQAPTAPQCPCCRRRIRTTEGATDEEKAEVKAKALLVAHDRVRAEYHARRLAHHQAEAQRLQTLVADRTREVTALAERVGLSAELTAHLAEVPPTDRDGRPLVLPHPTALANLQAQQRARLQTVAPLPPNPLPANQGLVRCPGCRTDRATVAFRHVRKLDGGTQRLKRCEGCQTAAQTAYANQPRPAN